jgi:hypothetical protein
MALLPTLDGGRKGSHTGTALYCGQTRLPLDNHRLWSHAGGFVIGRDSGRMKRWLRLRAITGVVALAVAVAAAAFISPGAIANTPVKGAAFTTVNETADGTGHCQNGNPNVNCNIYDGKQFVWMNGGPVTAALGDGTYFFAVLVPGGQGGNENPNDGTPLNLSDLPGGDVYGDRTFSISGGVISYTGPHDFANNKIRLMPYDDTTNPGGVYILAICSLADGYPVNPSDCKYDAFKVKLGEPCVTNCGPGVADDLTVTKGADGTYKTTWTWNIAKAVDKTLVKQVGGTVTFTYTVTAGHNGGVNSAITVTGSITVTNPNSDDVAIIGISDALSNGTNCVVTNGGSQNLPSGPSSFNYSCSIGGSTVPANLTNTATVSWPTQTLNPSGNVLVGNSASFTYPNDGTFIAFAQTKVDDCVSLADPVPSGGTSSDNPFTTLACVGDSSEDVNGNHVYVYHVTYPVPQFDCVAHTNTATFSTNTTATTGSASQTVTVCGPAHTGALTMGFWQNKNGQAIITGGASTAGICNSGTWLRQYAPFQDLSASATCGQVASYVTGVIKTANCTSTTNTCNSMLKSQMLATALDVYFSDPALGGNAIGAPAPIGGVAIDLTKICVNIPTCSTFENDSSVFGGATSKTVSQILAYAGSQSNGGGTIWYAQVKSDQVKAKDVFDAINNQVAFGA